MRSGVNQICVDDLLPQLSHAKYFTKIDLQITFLQLELNDDSSPWHCLGFLKVVAGRRDYLLGQMFLARSFWSVCNTRSKILKVFPVSPTTFFLVRITSEGHGTRLEMLLKYADSKKLNIFKTNYNHRESLEFHGHRLARAGMLADPETIRDNSDITNGFEQSWVSCFVWCPRDEKRCSFDCKNTLTCDTSQERKCYWPNARAQSSESKNVNFEFETINTLEVVPVTSKARECSSSAENELYGQLFKLVST